MYITIFHYIIFQDLLLFDQNNIIDAEKTRNDVYAHLKSEIDQAKASI